MAYQRKRARIEIIALIDIIFFLLATFVVVSISMIKNQGIKINLPSAVSSRPQERPTAKTITVTQSGEVYLDKAKIAMEELPAHLKELKKSGEDFILFINGDKEADFGLIVSVLDEIREHGIAKVVIQTSGANKQSTGAIH